MLPGHFNIPNHSGTAQKHRQAFSKIKEWYRKASIQQAYRRPKRPYERTYQRESQWLKALRILAIATALVLSAILGKTLIKDIPAHAQAAYRAEVATEQARKNAQLQRAYQIVLQEGYSYLQSGRLDQAQGAFVRALRANETGKTARMGLTETLLLQCQQHGKYCAEAADNLTYLRQINYTLFFATEGLHTTVEKVAKDTLSDSTGN